MTILAALTLILWIVSGVIAILNLALLPRLRKVSWTAEAPMVSVIVPARNEERSLDASLRALLEQDYPSFEVILVDDQSTDGTREIAMALATRDERLRPVDGEPLPAGWLGKPWAHHQGVRHSRGELLLFMDADVRLEPETLSSVVSEIQRSAAGLLALLPCVEMKGVWERLLMPQLAMAAFSFIPSWLANHTRWSRIAIGGGTGILVRRAVYDAAGGHERLRDAVIDDVSLARHCAAVAPFRLVVADDFVSVRMYHGLGEIVAGFTKNFYYVLGANLVTAALILIGSSFIHLAPYFWSAELIVVLWAGRSPALSSVLGALALAAILLTRVLIYARYRYGIVNALLGHVPMVFVWSWIGIRSTWIIGIRRQLGWRGRSYDARIKRFGS